VGKRNVKCVGVALGCKGIKKGGGFAYALRTINKLTIANSIGLDYCLGLLYY